METACSYLTDEKVMYFSSDEPKYVRRVEAWAKQFPDECQITTPPENNDGCICAKMPISWFRVRPAIKRSMTEEEKNAARGIGLGKHEKNDETEDDTEDA